MLARPRHPWTAVVPIVLAVLASACGAGDAGGPALVAPSDAGWEARPDTYREAAEASEPGDSAADVRDGAVEAGGPGPNEGWIGAACETEADCKYDDATCLSGFPAGMCSMPCEVTCPDPADDAHAGTFCIEDTATAGEGICVARCAFDWFGEAGCRDGMACRWRERIGQSWVVQDVCVADDGSMSCEGDEVRQPNLGIEEMPGLGGCPAGMAPIQSSGVCIDRWEAHLVQVGPGGDEAPWSPYFNPGGRSVRAVSAPGAVPQGYISGDQAAAACARAGKRLCTRSEWELACMGPDGHTYPYGDVREWGVCNDHRDQHPAIEYFGTSDAWIWSELGNACLNQLHDSLARTGARAGCVTADGVFDLMGNLHEWIDDPEGTFKGGYYVDTVINGEGCLYTTTAHATSHWDYSTGFRCCADL